MNMRAAQHDRRSIHIFPSFCRAGTLGGVRHASQLAGEETISTSLQCLYATKTPHLSISALQLTLLTGTVVRPKLVIWIGHSHTFFHPLRAVKQRMRSVQNIAKITSAMKMVAASKMRVAQINTEKSRGLLTPFLKLLGDLPGNVSTQLCYLLTHVAILSMHVVL